MAKYMKWLLPILFIAYYTSIASFMHVHIEHGVTIVHSHPFSKASGVPSHRHASLSEIQLFHILTTISAEDGAVHSLQLDFYTQQIARGHCELGSHHSSTVPERKKIIGGFELLPTALHILHLFAFANAFSKLRLSKAKTRKI